jgi:hypothetical protein
MPQAMPIGYRIDVVVARELTLGTRIDLEI